MRLNKKLNVPEPKVKSSDVATTKRQKQEQVEGDGSSGSSGLGRGKSASFEDLPPEVKLLIQNVLLLY